MATGFRVSSDKGQQPIKIYWLLEELKKKKIAQTAFAERLGITVQVLTGKKSVFPADKVDECMRLLENWDGATMNTIGGGRQTVAHPWQLHP